MDALRIDRWRFDATSLEVDEATGWLTMEGTAALVGVMQYADGAEFVPPETLADVESLLAAPLTVEHPPSMLDLETTRRYQVGSVLAARFDGHSLRVRLRVTDAEAAAAIQAGKRELSPGYSASIERESGAWQGKKYDAVQRKRRYNHLAFVDVARGGRQARLDSARSDGALTQETMDEEMIAVNINGTEYMVPAAVAAEIETLRTGKSDAVPPPPADDSAKTAPKMDALEVAKIAADLVTKSIRADRAEANRQAAELGEIVSVVRPMLPQSYRVDGKDAGTLVADAIVAKRPDLAGYVKQYRTDAARLRGMLDSLMSGETEVQTTEAKNDSKDDHDPVSAARDKQRLRLMGGAK